MYREHETEALIGKQSATFLVVVLFHLMLAVALYSGLASTMVKQFVPPPFNVKNIDTPPTHETPPTPPTRALGYGGVRWGSDV